MHIYVKKLRESATIPEIKTPGSAGYDLTACMFLNDKFELFTITGRKFYRNNITLTSGMPLKLVKEPDNEFDKDAIAIYSNNIKVGYVAK